MKIETSDVKHWGEPGPWPVSNHSFSASTTCKLCSSHGAWATEKRSKIPLLSITCHQDFSRALETSENETVDVVPILQTPLFPNHIVTCIKNCTSSETCSHESCAPGNPMAEGATHTLASALRQKWNLRYIDCCPSYLLLLKWERWLSVGGREALSRGSSQMKLLPCFSHSDSFSLFLPRPPWCLGVLHVAQQALCVQDSNVQ